MRLITAKTAGPIQAAETIIHGRRRGIRTSPQYRWTSHSRNTVHVNRNTARVFVLEAGHKKAHKAQNELKEKSMLKAGPIFLLCFLCLFVAKIPVAERAADAAAIRAHIESIFQAFIDGDEDKIFATHSEDWRGLLEGSRTPIKGIDEYMRANGIEWPRPANAPKSQPYFPAGTTYQVSDFDVHFYGPELAVANFFGEFQRKDGNTTITLRRFRIMDVYAKRKGSWIQVASHTVVDPAWRTEQMSRPTNLSPEIRQRILTAREAVWKAWFTNDRATLEKLIPEETIAIDAGGE